MRPQPDFSTAPRPSRLRSWDRAALVVAALAVVFAAGSVWNVRQEASEAAARLAQARHELETLTGRTSSFAARRQAQPGVQLGSGSSPARIVAAVASVLPADVRLQGLTISYARSISVQMQVEARSAAAWDRMLDRLERSSDFREVESGPESREAEVRSVVNASWAGGPRP